jgi:hypothetical protein
LAATAWLLQRNADTLGARPAATGFAAMYAATPTTSRSDTTLRSPNRPPKRCPQRTCRSLKACAYAPWSRWTPVLRLGSGVSIRRWTWLGIKQ